MLEKISPPKFVERAIQALIAKRGTSVLTVHGEV